jgi:hypothetical protein
MAATAFSLREAFRTRDQAGCTLVAGASSPITKQTRLIVRLWFDGDIGGNNQSKTWVTADLQVGVSKKDFEEALDAALSGKGLVRQRIKKTGAVTPFTVRESLQELGERPTAGDLRDWSGEGLEDGCLLVCVEGSQDTKDSLGDSDDDDTLDADKPPWTSQFTTWE